MLTQEFLHQGLIGKTRRGELFSRWLMILARDSLVVDPHSEYMPPFTVRDFLMSLYASDHHKIIKRIDSRILEARMNFTHFATTTKNLLPGGPTVDLCHDLLRRCAALQLNHGNPIFDQLIPIYFNYGKKEEEREEEFDRSKCGVIIIQNKNKPVQYTPASLFGEEFVKVSPTGPPDNIYTRFPVRERWEYAFKGIIRPVLFLLFDFDTTSGPSVPVQLSCSTHSRHPSLWAIHSRGHTQTIFGCLKTMGVGRAADALFTASTSDGKDIYHQIAKRNLVFNEMKRESRYAIPSTDESTLVRQQR